MTASCNLYYGWHQRTDYCQMFGYGWLEEREITLQMEEVNGVLRVTVPAMEFEHVASTWGHMAELALPEFTAELDPQTQRWEDVVHYDRDRRAYNDYCGAVQKGTMRKDVSIWNQTLYFSESENVQTNACCGAPRRTILCEVDLAAP